MDMVTDHADLGPPRVIRSFLNVPFFRFPDRAGGALPELVLAEARPGAAPWEPEFPRPDTGCDGGHDASPGGIVGQCHIPLQSEHHQSFIEICTLKIGASIQLIHIEPLEMFLVNHRSTSGESLPNHGSTHLGGLVKALKSWSLT